MHSLPPCPQFQMMNRFGLVSSNVYQVRAAGPSTNWVIIHNERTPSCGNVLH